MSKPKILILFYSMYGHIFRMAQAVVDGVDNEGGQPILRQVEDLLPEKYWDASVKKAKEMMKGIPVADPRHDFHGLDGLIVGTPTRYGNMCAQMRNFWDQTGGDWARGILIGKPASVFTSSATQHGGQETTIISTMITLLHHGLILVGLPYSVEEQKTMQEIAGGSPYGASTITGGMGERLPSAVELTMAKKLGERLTMVAKKLMEK